ncbi:MAG: hypothetical protein KTR33_10095 [Gammaproteobacteria bacterium]|nr:hypothetical protein [Gammaproteobacteria bacterium]
MNESESSGDREAVYSALQLFGNETRGEPPAWHELDDFQHHRLPVERSAEILSHIANSPVYFQQWLDLCEAEEYAASEAPAVAQEQHAAAATDAQGASTRQPQQTSLVENIRQWLAPLFSQPLPVYGGAFAAIMLAVLVVPLLRDTTTVDVHGKLERNMALYMAGAPGNALSAPVKPTTRSLGGLFGPPIQTDIEHFYFGKGLLESEAAVAQTSSDDWTAWRETLETASLDCSKSDNPEQCLSDGADYAQVGQWAMVAHLACQTPDSFATEGGYWSLQYELYVELQQLPAMTRSELLNPAMAAHQPDTPDAMCIAVTDLIKQAQ